MSEHAAHAPEFEFSDDDLHGTGVGQHLKVVVALGFPLLYVAAQHVRDGVRNCWVTSRHAPLVQRDGIRPSIRPERNRPTTSEPIRALSSPLMACRSLTPEGR